LLLKPDILTCYGQGVGTSRAESHRTSISLTACKRRALESTCSTVRKLSRDQFGGQLIGELKTPERERHTRCESAPFHEALLVVAGDVRVRPVKKVLVGVQLVLQKRPPELLLYQALTLRRMLPVRETNLLHDVVNVRHDALDDDVSVLALGLGEELGERLFGPVALLRRIGLPR